MKQTVELNTVELADRIDMLARKAAVIAAAMVGIKEAPSPEAIGGIIDMAWCISEELERYLTRCTRTQSLTKQTRFAGLALSGANGRSERN